mmetsp:Transcript_119787/g.382365  ORF Transcript_119787/g.382365 Transcript_119787/m.382365 type:complete len:232 (-) Transcript_119787:187-882(-)
MGPHLDARICAAEHPDLRVEVAVRDALAEEGRVGGGQEERQLAGSWLVRCLRPLPRRLRRGRPQQRRDPLHHLRGHCAAHQRSLVSGVGEALRGCAPVEGVQPLRREVQSRRGTQGANLLLFPPWRLRAGGRNGLEPIGVEAASPVCAAGLEERWWCYLGPAASSWQPRARPLDEGPWRAVRRQGEVQVLLGGRRACDVVVLRRSGALRRGLQKGHAPSYLRKSLLLGFEF